MATGHYSVRLVGKSGENSEGVFILDEDKDTNQCRLTLECPMGKITAEARDFWKAMCRIRQELETKGWRPVCYGASRNVCASSMVVEWGKGLRVYKVELGRTAVITDLVCIFDTAPDLQPVSVGEQMQFAWQWLESIRIKVTP